MTKKKLIMLLALHVLLPDVLISSAADRAGDNIHIIAKFALSYWRVRTMASFFKQ